MAGHSHWAGIKHKKGKADKQRSKIFSKLSKEITVAAKLGDKDPAMNPRLRSAVQAARSANMPKDNIERAIDKSSAATGANFENLRYEGLAIESGADECFSYEDYHEVQCQMSEIYNVKKNLEKIIVNFISTEIEWVPLNSVEVNKENKDNVVDFLETLEEDDDVQNVYSNVNLGGI